jgi:hypothetical protein
VVHFSGHAGGPDGLYFQDSAGGPQAVSPEAVARTLDAAGASVRLLVLNACFTQPVAEALLAHVDCVVGMNGAIHDDAARSLAIGFYGGLGEKESVAAAVKQGVAAILRQRPRDPAEPSGLQRDAVASKYLRGLQSADDKRVVERLSQVSGRTPCGRANRPKSRVDIGLPWRRDGIQESSCPIVAPELCGNPPGAPRELPSVHPAHSVAGRSAVTTFAGAAGSPWRAIRVASSGPHARRPTAVAAESPPGSSLGTKARDEAGAVAVVWLRG